MKPLNRFALSSLLPLLALSSPIATAQTTESSCVLPGILIEQDAPDDSVDGNDFSDIEFLSAAEPPDQDGKLVFTLKMRGLSQVPPGLRWVVRFSTPTPPPSGDDWYLGMTTENGTPEFVYGTTGVQPAGAPAGARLFTVLGDLEAGSAYSADGTILLVLNKAAIGAPQPGTILTPVAPFVRTPVTPNNQGILDEASGSGFYEVVGTAPCSSGKSFVDGVLGGSLSLGLLGLLAGAGVLRRRR